jgi:hypothetical protein
MVESALAIGAEVAHALAIGATEAVVALSGWSAVGGLNRGGVAAWPSVALVVMEAVASTSSSSRTTELSDSDIVGFGAT